MIVHPHTKKMDTIQAYLKNTMYNCQLGKNVVETTDVIEKGMTITFKYNGDTYTCMVEAATDKTHYEIYHVQVNSGHWRIDTELPPGVELTGSDICMFGKKGDTYKYLYYHKKDTDNWDVERHLVNFSGYQGFEVVGIRRLEGVFRFSNLVKL